MQGKRTKIEKENKTTGLDPALVTLGEVGSRAMSTSRASESMHADARRIAASVLQKAGALPSPGQELGVIPKDDWNQPRRANWSIDYFPPPDWRVPPPEGSTLGEAPIDPTESFQPWPDIQTAELYRYLRGIAQQGHQDSAHLHYQYYLQYRQDSMEARRRYENNLRRMREHTAHVDAGMTGPVMSTVKTLQCREVAALEAHKINICNSNLVKEKEALEKKLAASEKARAAAEEWATAAEQKQAERTSPSRSTPMSPAFTSAKTVVNVQQKKLDGLEKETQLLRAQVQNMVNQEQVEELTSARDAAQQKVAELTAELERTQSALEHLEQEGQQLNDECERLRLNQGAPSDGRTVASCQSRSGMAKGRTNRKGEIHRTPSIRDENVGSRNSGDHSELDGSYHISPTDYGRHSPVRTTWNNHRSNDWTRALHGTDSSDAGPSTALFWTVPTATGSHARGCTPAKKRGCVGRGHASPGTTDADDQSRVRGSEYAGTIFRASPSTSSNATTSCA